MLTPSTPLRTQHDILMGDCFSRRWRDRNDGPIKRNDGAKRLKR